MSKRFSHSPALHLQIARSRLCAALQLLQLGAALVAVLTLARQGRGELAGLVLLVIGCSLPRLWGQPEVGSELSWHAGQWCLDRGGGRRPIAPGRGCRMTPWAVLLVWREADSGNSRLWLFADAVDSDSWRRLRVRLRLLE